MLAFDRIQCTPIAFKTFGDSLVDVNLDTQVLLIVGIVRKRKNHIMSMAFDALKPFDDADGSVLADAPCVKVSVMTAVAERNAIQLNEWMEQCIPTYSFVTVSVDFGGNGEGNNGLHTFQTLEAPRKLVTINTKASRPTVCGNS